VGFRSPSADELARSLLARLADTESDDRRGRALYRDPRQPATAQPGAVPAAMRGFAASALQRLLGRPGALERALGEWITEPKPQVWFEPGTSDAPHGVQLDRRTRMAYDERHVFMNGESWRAAGRDAVLMQRLADRRRLDAPSLRSLSAGARAVLDEWLEAGWLRPLEPPQGDDDAP
jgi:50S ribosomal protein L16 3-hydroxylase